MNPYSLYQTFRSQGGTYGPPLFPSRDGLRDRRRFSGAGLALALALLPVLPIAAAPAGPKAAYWADPDKSESADTRYQTFASQLAGTEVSYRIYLPPDYETAAARRYPVVYWLHGLGGTQRTGEKFVAPLDAAIRAGKAPAMIAVLVNGMRDSLYCDSSDGKIPVESVIVRELVPHVDRTYRTLANRRSRAVEGFSMGGFGAPHLGFKYPEVFGVVGMMAGLYQDVESVVKPEVCEKMFGGDAGRVRPENPAVLLEKNLDAIRGRTAIRICVGDQDPGLARSHVAHEAMEKLGVPHEFHVVPAVAHNPEKLYQGLGDNAFGFYLKAFAPEAPRDSNPPAAVQIYKRPGDRDLKIALTLPPEWRAGDRRAAFIFFYNGGWKEGGASRQFEDQAGYFAQRGMVCAQADYREKSKDGVSTDQAVEDICSAIRWLRKNAATLGVDPGRVALAAGSGSVHLPLSVLMAEEIRAKDDDAAISPLPGAIFMFDADLDVLEPAKLMRLVTRDEASAARRNFPPTIYFYGARDVLQPHAEKFVARARAAGLPIEGFVETDGLHGAFKFSPWLEKTTARMDERLRELKFLSEHPRIDPPSKAKPEGLDERVLANQARWQERHQQLAQARKSGAAKKRMAQESRNPPEPVVAETPKTPVRRSFVYKTIGERKLELVVHYPVGWTNEDRRTALLLLSGGGFNPNDPATGRPNPTAEERAKAGMAIVENSLGPGMIPVADYFNARGVVAFRVDYRKRKTDGTLADKAVEDIGSAVRWIRQNAARLGIDSHRVVACGGSSGGHLAASVAALDEFEAADDDRSVSRRPDALILHSPLLDFVEGGTRATPFLAALNNDRGLAERLSPARHWRRDMPPTLLFTGTKEPVYQFLCDFAAKWKTAGQPVELVTGEGGHVYSLNEKFVAETLPRMETFMAGIGMMGVSPRETRAVEKPGAVAGPAPASYVYQTFGERKLQLAAHRPPGWKASDLRTAMLFFSGAHKVQPDANGKLPPFAAERAALGLPVVNRGPGENHADLCDAFAGLGLVCLRVEYRTRGRDGVLPGEDIADAFSAVRWVRRHTSELGIDPTRIVAAGGSSGGYLAASLFAFEDRHPDPKMPPVAGRPDAIILYSPLVDWLEVGVMSPSFLVVLNGDKELGARVSPARYWRKDSPPTLVMVGTAEPPFAAVRDFATKWKAAGASMELFVAEGSEHGFFGKPAWVERTLARTKEFLAANGLLERHAKSP
ncbi:MAG: hypothetical protein EXS37_16470 [Opitutus sp.]|nr:hypothetical protein [Opitutus sp.]